jgi:hypothetical protein
VGVARGRTSVLGSTSPGRRPGDRGRRPATRNRAPRSPPAAARRGRRGASARSRGATACLHVRSRASRGDPPGACTRTLPKPLALAVRLAPVGLAAIAALFGATLLPFWPAGLVAAIVLATGLATLLDPRLGLAIALATAVFPLGNLSQGAAIAYGAVAIGWLALCWRDARAGLLFVVGPLLAPLGLLAVVPLVVQPAHGAVRRAALAGLAVLSAALVAGVSGDVLPVTGSPAESLHISPLDSAREVAAAVVQMLAHEPGLLVAGLAVALVAAFLPLARTRWKYGVLAVGAVVTVCSVALGASPAAVPAVALGWAAAGALAAGTHRGSI